MKLKHKLHAGFWLLFVVVIFFGAISLFYLRLISKSNAIILKENYATLQYINQMRAVLDEHDLPLPPAARQKFKSALIKEQNNITEKGEQEAVAGLSRNFETLNNTSTGIEQQRKASREVLIFLGRIEQLNLLAIERKNQDANQSIRNATVYLGAASAITFIILFSFVFNLADFFEEPLQRITEGIEQISSKNYNARLYLDRKDEFGEVSESFNKMAQGLEELNLEKAAHLSVEKLFIDRILNQFPYPLIAVNNLSEIKFVSSSAEQLFKFDKNKATGLTSAAENTQLRNLLKVRNSGPIEINDSQYQLEIQEISPILNQQSEFEADFIIKSGKPVGYIYILKKQT